MAIKEKLSDADLALVEVLEDPVFFSEFMRSTRDGSPVKSTWPDKDFKYRWYQRDLITDKSEYIVLTGGRAVGKCQPIGSKVYTTKGYKSINKIFKEGGVCEVYCMDDDKQITSRRAVVVKDKTTAIYKVTTQSGHELKGTANHPVLTQRGFINIEDLLPNDEAIVTTRLPWHNPQNLWRSAELRYLGYRFFDERWFAEIPFKARFKAIEQDYKRLAEELGAIWAYQDGGVVIMRPARYMGKNQITYAAMQLGWMRLYEASNMSVYPRLLPDTLMSERRENLQIFLESVLAQWGVFTSTKKVALDCKYERTGKKFQELFLRCGVEMRLDGTVLTTATEYAAQYLYYYFNLEGVSVKVNKPEDSWTRADPIAEVSKIADFRATYALYVYDHHNYISENIWCHNSLVLEDKQLFDLMNHDTQLPDTKELLITTPNQAQLEPIYGRLISRLTSSILLKDFLQNRINRSSGTMELKFSGIQVLHRARIAGSKETNLVGLHVPRIIIDEGQLYSEPSYKQLRPALNVWQRNVQMFIAGVPNGWRNSSLYITSIKTPRFKWYRVPSPNNSYFSKEDYFDALRTYGGDENDDFQQLVLGKHGAAAMSVINRDQITQKPYDFHNYRYNGGKANKVVDYKTALVKPDLKDYKLIFAGVDCGYADPTIINIVGLTKEGPWRILARYRLTRVQFPLQEEIINWLDDTYKFERIAIDIGAGGGGTQIMQSLLERPNYGHKNYKDRITAVQFNERMAVGYTTGGVEVADNAKSIGAQQLVTMMQDGMLEFSELDNEGLSEMERITRQRLASGSDQYYILNDRGSGKSSEDHIFASLICFAIAVREAPSLNKVRVKLGRTRGKVL